MKVGKRPARFFLKERAPELPPDAVAKIEKEESKKKEKKTEYHERGFHPLLTYFAYANPIFNRGTRYSRRPSSTRSHSGQDTTSGSTQTLSASICPSMTGDPLVASPTANSNRSARNV